ncbi:MAG: hypothetical protein SXA11_09735 [Cyanobacteriota bacterium]|nr:hypothetical protein [Cyanobacteriota bacterium]
MKRRTGVSPVRWIEKEETRFFQKTGFLDIWKNLRQMVQKQARRLFYGQQARRLFYGQQARRLFYGQQARCLFYGARFPRYARIIKSSACNWGLLSRTANTPPAPKPFLLPLAL